MPEPEYTPFGLRLAERCEPMQPEKVDAQHDYAFGNLCEAMMHCYIQIQELVDPEEEGLVPWETLFDVDLCPYWALPWLAQVVGVQLLPGLSEDAARQYIKDLSFEQTGKPETIRKVVQTQLVGTKTVYFRERDTGDAYRLEIVTLTNETPDLSALDRAIKASVPAGILVNDRTVVGWDYQQMTAEGGTYADQNTAFDNYFKMSGNDRS
jgi:hypothetical protein